MKLPTQPDPPRTLRNLGIAILFIGAGLAYFIGRDKTDPDAQSYFRLAMLATALASGICFISAAAKWFMRR
jgi:hypothetical protein